MKKWFAFLLVLIIFFAAGFWGLKYVHQNRPTKQKWLVKASDLIFTSKVSPEQKFCIEGFLLSIKHDNPDLGFRFVQGGENQVIELLAKNQSSSLLGYLNKSQFLISALFIEYSEILLVVFGGIQIRESSLIETAYPTEELMLAELELLTWFV